MHVPSPHSDTTFVATRPRHEGTRPIASAARLVAARRYLIDHVDRRVSLAAAAAAAGLSAFHFQRLFKARYGDSPRRFHERLRVDNARRLIALGCPLSRVAHAAGFCDQSHLARVFKRLVGMPPGRFATLHRSARQPIAALAIWSLLSGCGGGSSGSTTPPEPPPPPPPGAFAGTYATRVTLASNTCGTIVVQDNPTTVTHNLATGAVSFTHVGQTYVGVVAADSSFSTTPKGVDVDDGYVYMIALRGRFRTAAFDADATVDRSDAANETCRFVVHWAGTR